MTAFSVLLPVYAGDDPAFFARALRSVSTEQTLRPDEIVIVRDGEVSDGIEAVLDAAIDGSAVGDVPVTVVRIGHNRGLAAALVEGLKACRYEIVARADADDISLPRRFATQIPLVVGGDDEEPLDLLGAAIQEFVTGKLMTITTVGGEKIYDFGYATEFWVGAALLSTLLALLVWNAKPQDEA